jgi:hypothetical protein
MFRDPSLPVISGISREMVQYLRQANLAWNPPLPAQQ